MVLRIKNFLLLAAIHAFKSKFIISKLQSFWMCDELALHKRYSPFQFEIEIYAAMK